MIDGLVAETVEHAVRVHAEAAALARLARRHRRCPGWSCPQLVDGVDLGSLYELAEALVEQGVGEPARSGVEVVSPRAGPACWTSTRCSTTPTPGCIVCCGSGGVGKTTTSAALAVRAAERGRRTVVLTIDPARRLAQALGLEALGNEPGRVAGVEARGRASCTR